jgi:tyramine---L-glutamate ligase
MMRMISRPNVLIYEYFTGGGCPPGELPRGLAEEALGMLWALVTDFHRWGAVRIMTALDPRFEEYMPGFNRATLHADEIVMTTPGNYLNVYESLLQRCDAVWVIAPETGDILATLISLAEKAGIPHLGSNSAAARTAGNKAECARIFLDHDLPAPMTLIADRATAFEKALQIGFPLIIKPIDGVGCEGVCRANSMGELTVRLQQAYLATAHEHVLLQSYVRGIPASVSLLVTDGETCFLSLNRQLMQSIGKLHYSGSRVPYRHVLKAEAWNAARSAVDLIGGLRGYVGVDLVLTKQGIQLIEINPRLTTSYLGLRQVTKVNLVQAVWNVCMHNSLPAVIPLCGKVVIKKDVPDTWGMHRC